MNGSTIFTTFAKGVGYLGFALNQMLKLAMSGARYASDAISDNKRYDIELLVGGATIETKRNLSGTQLSKVVRIMGEVGIDQAIITDSSTRKFNYDNT